MGIGSPLARKRGALMLARAMAIFDRVLAAVAVGFLIFLLGHNFPVGGF